MKRCSETVSYTHLTSLQIEQLTVTGFGCFADEHTWTFGRMTTVTGHNYQGKSTIADAIAYALTGAPFFGGRDLDRLQNESSPFMRAELTVRTDDGKTHEIRRARQGGKTALSVDCLLYTSLSCGRWQQCVS